MRTSSAIAVACAAAMLAACSPHGASLPAAVSYAIHAHPDVSSSETVVHAFKGGSDGAGPEPILLPIAGEFYGVTMFGGGSKNCSGGCGTIFKIGTSGTGYQKLYSFQGGTDGGEPISGLTLVGSNLYGTTFRGGGSGCATPTTKGCGTVFKAGANSYSVVYRFAGGSDASGGASGLSYYNGLLYGTSFSGGGSGCVLKDFSTGCGTVYSIDPSSGKERVLYRFKGGNDGGLPIATPLLYKGLLYGVAGSGGGTGCGGGGCGIVFSVDPATGKERIVHRFGNGKDAALPQPGFAEMHGAFYGTASAGGARGLGAIYKIDLTTGSESVVYSFKGGKDGSGPSSGLTAVGGRMYGGTVQGGSTGCVTKYYTGCGTIYAVDASGGEGVLYAFKGGNDGEGPESSVTPAGGALYGTTQWGGGKGCVGLLGTGVGCGTIFKLVP